LERNKQAIDHFFEAFRSFLEFIDKYCKGRFESVALICIYIDSLSGYKYGKRGNRNRFIKFIMNYSGLSNIYSRVCLPLIRSELRSKHPAYKDIINFFASTLNVTEEENAAGFTYDNSDIPLDEFQSKLRARFPDENKVKNVVKIASSLRYVDYFYNHYRCKVIHEARMSEKEAPYFKEHEEPFYVPVADEDGKKEIWFGIPFKFMRRTLLNCIENFEEECIARDINPFEAFIEAESQSL
jgi:hypothetical protein